MTLPAPSRLHKWGLKAVLRAGILELNRPGGDPKLVIQQLRAAFIAYEEAEREAKTNAA